MSPMPNVPFIDGHNDFLLRLLRTPEQREELWLGAGQEGHLDLPRMQKAGFAGGFFRSLHPLAAGGQRT